MKIATYYLLKPSVVERARVYKTKKAVFDGAVEVRAHDGYDPVIVKVIKEKVSLAVEAGEPVGVEGNG